MGIHRGIISGGTWVSLAIHLVYLGFFFFNFLLKYAELGKDFALERQCLYFARNCSYSVASWTGILAQPMFNSLVQIACIGNVIRLNRPLFTHLCLAQGF